ncbi:OsmC family protein [Mucilaginibacter ginsenosidivorans]|uniref:OsmC family peroxiredoxin n=1 Tax=Mucilaginibacter ginsenosidivorans TaxID=398053 RepID=A0A5B8USC0_9SPHI|nr:OsmC family protein [Mucilaginibacter ginsenosidivorans]QEC61869.1 OsmC family peroxiredoxin [Mucilaginibacter ginsenosidivorans]
MERSHTYNLTITWTGNRGTGTSDYRAYDRNHIIRAENKIEIPGSSDPAFRGDKTRYNPEEFLVSALSTCHMLSYLHVCVMNGVVVTGYIDHATGTMAETPGGGGHFTEVVLNPVVTVKDAAMVAKANELHHKASQLCFIANSVNFPVKHTPTCVVEGD